MSAGRFSPETLEALRELLLTAELDREDLALPSRWRELLVELLIDLGTGTLLGVLLGVSGLIYALERFGGVL